MHKKIMVVDDDRDTRLLLQVILRKEGYDVCTACNGDEALLLVNQEKPDLVILDAMMCGLNGFDTLKAMRTQNHTSTLPVVMLSAQTASEGVMRAWRAGVDLYLEKPFDPHELTSYIERIFQERRRHADRRVDLAQSERRAAERRRLTAESTPYAGLDRRSTGRRVMERRETARRLDFAAD